MADYGIKASRIGYNVNEASDKQLAFSSEWPLLPIEAEGDLTINPPGGGSGNVSVDIYTHNLGYNPVFYVQRTSGGSFFPGWTSCDTSKLYFSGYVSSAINLKWKIFRRNLLTNYLSGNYNTTDATKVVDGDYGIFISLPGKSISSTNKRDFVIRSDVRQLMIHQSGYVNSSAQLVVTHNLGYQPMYLIFAKSGTRYQALTQSGSTWVSATDTQLTAYDYGASIADWAYIIFKDTLTTNG